MTPLDDGGGQLYTDWVAGWVGWGGELAPLPPSLSLSLSQPQPPRVTCVCLLLQQHQQQQQQRQCHRLTARLDRRDSAVCKSKDQQSAACLQTSTTGQDMHSDSATHVHPIRRKFACCHTLLYIGNLSSFHVNYTSSFVIHLNPRLSLLGRLITSTKDVIFLP